MTEATTKDIERIAKPGDILAGKYLVERLLGVGGMGAVVAATHTQLDQRVAIKFLLPSMMSSKDVVERFQREARAAAKIKSEHVVRVSDVGTLEGGVPYIVMEFLEGRDLGDLLARRGPLPIPLAVDYVLEASEALAEAHAAGIVHRDLKPANLFLARRPDETEIVKVLDFGISKTLSPEALVSSPSLTKTTDVFGSPTYMSPEQLKASRDVDMRADVWALGVILFELLAGEPPFGGGTVAEIFGAILHKPAPRIREIRKDIPAEIERVLLRCLEKEVPQRYQNVGELAEALAPFGSDGARASMARVTRMLRTSGGLSRASLPGREPLPSSPGSSPAIDVSSAVQASTAAGSDKPGASAADADAPRPPSPGSSTATSWGHAKPTPKKSSGRIALLAAAALGAAALGALLVLKVMAPAGSAGSGAQPASSLTAEALPAPTPVPAATVSPAPTTTAAAAPPTPTAVVTPGTALPAPTGAPKPTGRIPTTPTAAASAAPTTAPTTAPTAKPTTPDPPKTTAPSGGDDDFGGRR